MQFKISIGTKCHVHQTSRGGQGQTADAVEMPVAPRLCDVEEDTSSRALSGTRGESAISPSSAAGCEVCALISRASFSCQVLERDLPKPLCSMDEKKLSRVILNGMLTSSAVCPQTPGSPSLHLISILIFFSSSFVARPTSTRSLTPTWRLGLEADGQGDRGFLRLTTDRE